MRSLRNNWNPLVRFIIEFALATGGFFVLYYLLFNIYSSLVFAGAEILLKMSNRNLGEVITRPTASFVGFLFRGDAQVYAIRYNPYFIFMNLPITLALITASPAMRASDKLKKTGWAVLILLCIHWIETFVDLAYACSTIVPAAKWVPYGPVLKRFLFEINRLYNHMGQYLAPFLIWFFLCRESLIHPFSKAGTPIQPGTVGRNDPCPCGSGKKYKACCGR